MTGSFRILLFEGTLHVDKIHVRFKMANITHALPVPVYRQTDFTPKRVVVSRLHDTVARFRTGVKFSPRYNNRGDSRRHDILWWYHVNKCRGTKVAPVSCKHPAKCYLLLLLFSHNVCLESLGPRSNHDPGALGDSQFLA